MGGSAYLLSPLTAWMSRLLETKAKDTTKGRARGAIWCGFGNYEVLITGVTNSLTSPSIMFQTRHELS